MYNEVISALVICSSDEEPTNINQFLIINGEVVAHTDNKDRTSILAEFHEQNMTEFDMDAKYIANALNIDLERLVFENHNAFAEFISESGIMINHDSVFKFLFEDRSFQLENKMIKNEKYQKTLICSDWFLIAVENIDAGEHVCIDISSSDFSNRELVVEKISI